MPFCRVNAGFRIKHATIYPAGAILFVEGQAPRGIFVVCKGRVKLSFCSTDGKKIILRIAEAGEVMGISSGVSSTPYQVTAETLNPCQISFVKRDDFVQFMKDHRDVCLRVAEELSNKYHSACRELRSYGLSHSAVAKLLLE
jgi:CRP/FNR family transcriptional regulator, cyclic AMP receptor protein